jgi:leucyl aminopeptidase
MPDIRIEKARPEMVECDLLVLPVFKGGALGAGGAEVERAIGAKFKPLLEQNRIKGNLGDTLTVPTFGKIGASQVMLVGLGEKGKVSADAMRKAGGNVARRTQNAKRVVTSVPQSARDGAAASGAFVEGFLLGEYRFDRYKAPPDGEQPPRVERLTVLSGQGWDARKAQRSIERARVIAEATNLARDLTNIPAGDKSPQSLAEEARTLARGNSIKVQILTEKELQAQGFGGILGVGRGSEKPPRFIVMRYEPAGAKRTIALVGKGITFDSGGINLKTSSLDWMKMDMAGAAAVLGTMSAIGKLKPKVAVWGLVCSAENMPSGSALHPGDILRIYGGKTVEVGDTDAEGRLVMADGIAWAAKQGAKVIVDIATLTGAIVVALGNKSMGVLGSDRKEVRAILDAAERAGERGWELPLYDDYRPALDSDIADLRNISNRNIGAGAITAGLFLKEFTNGVPWVHLDIAGTAKGDNDEFEVPKGGTGAAVRTLVEWIVSQ